MNRWTMLAAGVLAVPFLSASVQAADDGTHHQMVMRGRTLVIQRVADHREVRALSGETQRIVRPMVIHHRAHTVRVEHER